MRKLENAIQRINDKVLEYTQAKQWVVSNPFPSTEGIEVYYLEDCYALIWQSFNQAE